MKKRTIAIIVCLSMVPLTVFGAQNADPFAGEPASRLDALEGIYEEHYETANTALLQQFSDYNEMSAMDTSAQKTLATMVEMGILKGYADNSLRPLGTLTRAEYAVMLYRAQTNFNDLPKLVEYFVPYSDVTDWNAEAIRFCVEHGLMMGDGSIFDVDGSLTKGQTATVKRRMISGLNTLERYTLLSLNGVSALNMTKINQSVNDEALKVENREQDTRIPLGAKLSAIEVLQNYMDIAYNFDYRKYATDETLMELAKKIDDYSDLSWGEVVTRTDEIYELLKRNKEGEYIAESFFVTSPQLFWWGGWGSTYFQYEAHGYFYFKIESGIERAAENNIPIRYKRDMEQFDPTKRPAFKLEEGKWYRQAITVFRTKDKRIYFTVSGSETIELLPDDFYN